MARGVAAEFEEQLLHRVRGTAHDTFADFGRAREGNFADALG